jgi:hypothetical protein
MGRNIFIIISIILILLSTPFGISSAENLSFGVSEEDR